MPFIEKTQYFFHLSFHSILKLINGTSSDLQTLLKYFNGAAIEAFFRIPLAWFEACWATVFPVFPYNLALYLKDSQLLVLAISALKLAA